MDVLHELGRVSRNLSEDIRARVTLYRGRPYISLEMLATGAEEQEDPQRPRVLSLSARTVRDLLPMLAEGQALAARFEDGHD